MNRKWFFACPMSEWPRFYTIKSISWPLGKKQTWKINIRAKILSGPLIYGHSENKSWLWVLIGFLYALKDVKKEAGICIAMYVHDQTLGWNNQYEKKKSAFKSMYVFMIYLFMDTLERLWADPSEIFIMKIWSCYCHIKKEASWKIWIFLISINQTL